MKIAILALLAVHGLIHAMGFAGAWGLAEASRVPTNLITAGPGDPIVRVLGLLWLLAFIAFLVAAYMLVADTPAWRPAAVVAVVVSMVPVTLWLQDAPVGVIANTLVLATVFLAPRLKGVPA